MPCVHLEDPLVRMCTTLGGTVVDIVDKTEIRTTTV